MSVGGQPEIRAVHVGRQALYDRAGDVVAYELLFRNAPDALVAATRGSYATSQVIVAAFTEFGINELVGDKPCFVNLTREFLVGDLPLPFDARHAGLEILADIVVDDAVVAGVAALAEEGYTITVDDYAIGQDRDALLPFATYAKVDMLHADAETVTATIEHCRQYSHLQLVAERLETTDLLSAAFDWGFQLFQGNVLGRPHLVTTHVLNPSRLHRLKLLADLCRDDVNLDDAVDTIERDPALALRILRGANAASNSFNRQISSVFEAVILIGTAQVRRWATLMLASDLAEGDEVHLSEAVIRARMCQTLAEKLGQPGHSAFIVGLLSAVVDMMNLNPADIASQLPIADDIAVALLDGRGRLGEIVNTVRNYQHGLTPEADLGGVNLADDLLSAMRWTTASLEPA